MACRHCPHGAGLRHSIPAYGGTSSCPAISALGDSILHVVDGSDEPKEQPYIRVDQLTSRESPRIEIRRPKNFVRRIVDAIGTPTGLELLARGETGKVRIFNAAFIVSTVGVIVALICCGVFIAVAVGTVGNGGDWLLAAISLLLGAFLVGEVTWGMCVVVSPTDVTVRRHYIAQRFPIAEIASAEVRERLLLLKPVMEVDLNTEAGERIRTPLLATGSQAGRSTTEQAC